MSAVLQPQFDFRAMRESDLDVIIEIESRIYEFPWTAGNFIDSMMAGYSCQVLLCDDELVGYAVLMCAADEAHLLNLSIALRHCRRGYGTRLLRRLFEIARERCAAVLLLEVRPSNAAARALYQSFGFSQIGLRRGYYPALVNNVATHEDALVLSCKV